MMWGYVTWLLEHWLLVVWAVGVVVAYIYGGRYAALVVATLGFGSFMYNWGKSDVNKRAKKVEQRRKNAYDQIDNRGTDRDDVVERLRKRSY